MSLQPLRNSVSDDVKLGLLRWTMWITSCAGAGAWLVAVGDHAGAPFWTTIVVSGIVGVMTNRLIFGDRK